jgi:hypothetical protein
MLAYYCSRRAHLEALGLSIALTCSQEELYDVAGRAGLVLAERARGTMTDTEPTKLKSRQGITLASGPLWQTPRPRD